MEMRWNLVEQSKSKKSPSKFQGSIPFRFSPGSGARQGASGASRALLGAGSELEPSSRTRLAADSSGVALKKRRLCQRIYATKNDRERPVKGKSLLWRP